ncbi:MAG: LptF/LptG family permease [Aquificaceae bacterium]|nr:LptF/LptG family permease [Aquificaceae bacterium]MDW8423031.1 LptF/LptG family permease [Aquificaceae bacterium]
MLFRWFLWKFIRLAFFISFTLTFVFLIFQIVRFDQIILQLPIRESLPFLSLWFFYYLFYMLPVSLFISFAINLFELKESKKLHIIQSFGIEPAKVYTKSLLLAFPFFASLFVGSSILKEEDVSYIRKQLMIKYYAYIITSIPPKSFHSFGQFTLYVEERDGNRLGGVFFKFQEGVVIAKRAQVKKEEIIFEKGSLLTHKEGKTFSTDFSTYRLSLNTVITQREKSSEKAYIRAFVNLSLSILLMGIAYRLVWIVEHHHRFYYVVALLSVFHQALLFFLKQRL